MALLTKTNDDESVENRNYEVQRGGKMLQTIFGLLFRIVEAVGHFLLGFIYKNAGERIPPIENLILLDSATVLAQKIRRKRLTSVEVVQSFINRIKDINKVLNAVVDDRFEDAINDAKKADEFIANSGKTEEELARELPFLGVPFTTKDCISVKGMTITGGLYYRRNVVVDEDADVIHQMRRAGAIPLAITNVSELCMWWESYNKHYGRTNNAYNTNHIVGGSSGGEGCLLSAAGSPMGIGSDIGGSVRMPAFFNGIFGHKPSTGVGSLKGHKPIPKEAKQRSFLASGPMSKFASDLKPMLKIMAPDQAEILQLDTKVDVSKIKFYYMEDDGGGTAVSSVEPEIREAIRRVVAYLKRVHNINAEKVNFPALKSSMAMWFAKMKLQGESQLIQELADNKGSVNVLWEIFKLLFGFSNHTLPVLGAALLENYNYSYGCPKHMHLVHKADDLLMDFQNLLGTDGIFIYPTHPTAAPYHTEPLLKPFNVAYTAIFNILGLPSTQCPMGLNKYGLPIGLQVVGNRNQDRLCLAVAEELEKAFGGWVQPQSAT